MYIASIADTNPPDTSPSQNKLHRHKVDWSQTQCLAYVMLLTLALPYRSRRPYSCRTVTFHSDIWHSDECRSTCHSLGR